MSENFTYTTYIRTEPSKLWNALTQPDVTRQYWFGAHQQSAWTEGASWHLLKPDNTIADSGEILEAHPPHRLVLTWRNETDPALTGEGFSRATYTIERTPHGARLTVTHEIPVQDSLFLKAVAHGWPLILSSLTSLLETGAPLPGTSAWPG